MATFKEMAEELLKSADIYRKNYYEVINPDILSKFIQNKTKDNNVKDNITEYNPVKTIATPLAMTSAAAALIGLGLPAVVGASLGAVAGIAGEFMSDKDNKNKDGSSKLEEQNKVWFLSLLLKMVNESPSDTFTIQKISELTGLEDWKLRRYIGSELIAERRTNGKDKGNPGRAGYEVTKENLQNFIIQKSEEISNTQAFNSKMLAYRKAQTELITRFLTSVTQILDIGNLEKQLIKDTKSPEYITIQILLKKLVIEKEFFERERDSFMGVYKKDCV